ncbi:hypothetical protein BH11PSE4_BH11PSE4_23980 [soil metagenome]
MRSLLTAAALLVVMGATPGIARDYPWCSRTSASSFNPSCSFTSFNQCMATVSGQAGECVLNPILAFGRQLDPHRRRRARDDGWNQRW